VPLTLPTLASLVPAQLGARLQLLDEGLGDIPMDLEADLIGISAITGSAPRAYELADHFRRRGICTVLGGVHPTLLPDEAARHADSVVTGYAEDSWPQLLQDFVQGKLQSRYRQQPGLSLSGRPQARRDLYPAGGVTVAHTVEATRGCIHRCNFCVVPTAWGRPLQHPVAEVVADLKQMNARRVIFLDLNLIADLDYARELFEALIPLNLEWGGLATTAIAREPGLLSLARRSGCRGLLIGFESLTPAALQECKKGFNLLADAADVVAAVHAEKISLMGTFVFGFDHDDPNCFERTAEFVHRTGIELPRFAVLTPFPATPLFVRLENEERILTRDWSLYDGQHVVFRPQQMSPEALLRGTERAWKQTYGYRSLVTRLWRGLQPWRWRGLSDLRFFATALAANLGYRFYAYNLSRFYNCRDMLLAA
jgi:radical SAM superfamily enzyme YgiQ (UPF0313 family)